MASGAMANVGAWMLMVIMEQLSSSRRSFAQNLLEISVCSLLRNLPQFRQKFSGAMVFLHFGHGGCFCGVGYICIFRIFSAMSRMSSIPMKMSSRPATVWNTIMAISSPSQYPIETIVVMRMMFRISNMKNPRMKIPAFFRVGAEVIRARKAANIVKAIREYIPEHGRSIVNDNGCPAGVMSAIVGGPKDEVSVTGKPRVLSRV